MNLLYIDDYKRDEENILRELGIECSRITKERGITGAGFAELDRSRKYIVRGLRMEPSEYQQVWSSAFASGLTLVTSPRSYEIGASFAEQYKLFAQLSPGAIVLEAETSNNDILLQIKQHNICLPAFLRSDIESAAKYVGFDGCVIKDGTIEEVERVVNNLRSHVRGFSALILKEVVGIATDPSSGQRLEYRAIGIGGKVLGFDFDGSQHLMPEPAELNLSVFAERALALLASGGANGGLFLDVAITVSKEPIVVECKNLLNGTIIEIKQFGKELANIQ